MKLYDFLNEVPTEFMDYKKVGHEAHITRLNEMNIINFLLGTQEEDNVLTKLQEQSEDYPLVCYENNQYTHTLYMNTNEEKEIEFFIKTMWLIDEDEYDEDDCDILNSQNVKEAIEEFFIFLKFADKKGM